MPLPRPRPGQGKWWALAAFGIAAMSALAVWFGVNASKGVSYSQAGFTVASDHRVNVAWDVTSPQKKPVDCTIVAMDIKRNVVGTKKVTLAPSKYESTRYHEDLLTTSRAVTGTVQECHYQGERAPTQ